jgi:hypothetical protein
VSGRSPVQGVLPIVYRFTNKNPSTPEGKRGQLRRKEGKKERKIIHVSYILDLPTGGLPSVFLMILSVFTASRVTNTFKNQATPLITILGHFNPVNIYMLFFSNID